MNPEGTMAKAIIDRKEDVFLISFIYGDSSHETFVVDEIEITDDVKRALSLVESSEVLCQKN